MDLKIWGLLSLNNKNRMVNPKFEFEVGADPPLLYRLTYRVLNSLDLFWLQDLRKSVWSIIKVFGLQFSKWSTTM